MLVLFSNVPVGQVVQVGVAVLLPLHNVHELEVPLQVLQTKSHAIF